MRYALLFLLAFSITSSLYAEEGSNFLFGLETARSISVIINDGEFVAGTPGSAVDTVWVLKTGEKVFGLKLGVNIPDGSSRVGIRISPAFVFKLGQRVSMALPALLWCITPGYGDKDIIHVYGGGVKFIFKTVSGVSVGPSVLLGKVHDGPWFIGFKFDVTFWLSNWKF